MYILKRTRDLSSTYYNDHEHCPRWGALTNAKLLSPSQLMAISPDNSYSYLVFNAALAFDNLHEGAFEHEDGNCYVLTAAEISVEETLRTVSAGEFDIKAKVEPGPEQHLVLADNDPMGTPRLIFLALGLALQQPVPKHLSSGTPPNEITIAELKRRGIMQAKGHKLTPKGWAWVDMIISTPEPEKIWADPRPAVEVDILVRRAQ